MIIGHQKQWYFLSKATETTRFSHAYLFSGLEKLGKRTLALELVSFLFRQDVKKLNSHPDMIFIEPQAKEIKISQIKDLIWRLSLRPSLARTKVAIIDNAHLMNQEAQTCLLKTLEEPKGNTLLILITDKIQELFPTILSRVQTIKFYPVNDEEIKDYLKKQQIAEKDLEEISEISAGRPGVVVDFVKDKQKINIFRERIKEIEKISKADLTFRFQYVKDLSENLQQTRELLDVWTSYFRGKLINAVGDQRPTLGLRKILNFLQKTNFLISSTNVNPRLALETLMIELN